MVSLLPKIFAGRNSSNDNYLLLFIAAGLTTGFTQFGLFNGLFSQWGFGIINESEEGH